MNIQKGFASLALMVVLSLLVAAGGGWYLYKKSAPVSVSDSKLMPDTTGLKAVSVHNGASVSVKTTEDSATSVPPPFLTFVSPQTGAQVNAVIPVQVKWKFDDPSILKTFPSKDTYVVLHIIDSDGKDIGSVGDGSLSNTTSVTWNIASYLTANFYKLSPGEKYTIHATLAYQPSDFTCAPSVPPSKDCTPLYTRAEQVLIAKAKQYQSESGPFTVDLSLYKRPSATLDQTSLTVAFSNRGTSSLSGTSNTDALLLNIREHRDDINADPPATHPLVEQHSIKVPVSGGVWSYPVPMFPAGTYDVDVWNSEGSVQLTVGTLRIF